jgi:hypothetical protein
METVNYKNPNVVHAQHSNNDAHCYSKYRVGDIVNFRVGNSILIGQIVRKVDGWYEGDASYYIKLFSDFTVDIRFLSYKYRPNISDEEWFDKIESDSNNNIEARSTHLCVDRVLTCNVNNIQNGLSCEQDNPSNMKDCNKIDTSCSHEVSRNNTCRIKIIRVSEKKINFSIKKEDINPFLEAKTNGERFKYLLRGCWSNLKMRKVKTVKLDQKNVLGQTTLLVNTALSGDHEYKFVDTRMNACCDKKSIVLDYYTYYFGFTRKYEDDTKDVFFSKDNYRCIDMDVHCDGQFGTWGNHTGGYHPPWQGQFVCGTIKNGEKGPFFDNWFVSSDAFFHFWKYVMDNKEYNAQRIEYLLKQIKQPDHYSTEMTEDQLLENAKRNYPCFDKSGYWYDCIVKYIAFGEIFEIIDKFVYNISGVIIPKKV